MIHIAWPWAYLLLPLPLLARYLLPIATCFQSAALRVPFFKQIKNLQQTTITFHWRVTTPRQWLIYSMWLLLIIALSGPQWLGEPVAMPRNGRDLLLAIDLSGSMQTPDMTLHGKSASRLSIVKHVANQFIKNRIGDRVGLIVFGSRAYLQTPLTFDRKTVQNMLSDATIGLAGSQTAIGDAIGLAVKRLMQYPAQSRALILLTDGGNNAGVVTPLATATLAKQEGIKIYTIGIRAEKMVIPGLFGTHVVPPTSDL